MLSCNMRKLQDYDTGIGESTTTISPLGSPQPTCRSSFNGKTNGFFANYLQVCYAPTFIILLLFVHSHRHLPFEYVNFCHIKWNHQHINCGRKIKNKNVVIRPQRIKPKTELWVLNCIRRQNNMRVRIWVLYIIWCVNTVISQTNIMYSYLICIFGISI